MKLSFLKNKNLVNAIVILVFIIWMLFIDANSYLYQIEYNREIDQLENTIEFYSTEIEKNSKVIQTLSIPENLNKYAREKYHYKKKEEYLYLIEYDTLH